ncbi:MAG: hypothetical protein NC132_06955 [Corallococcus sp.]|nr:hypothetical protein [Corallococcus sp.]
MASDNERTLRYHTFTGLLGLLFVFLCLLSIIIIIIIVICQEKKLAVGLGILGLIVCIPCILLIITFIVSIANVTNITKDQIVQYQYNKITKQIAVSQIKRIVVVKILTRSGKKRTSIIFDDGTVKPYYEDQYYLDSGEAFKRESWISIAYTYDRLFQIHEMLPNCPIEELDTNKWAEM